MKTSRALRLTLLASLIALPLVGGFSGCTQVQVSPETLGEYKLGELQVWTDKDFRTACEATKLAFADLKLFQTQDDRKVIEADLHARDTADTLIIVKIKEVAKGRTSVKIRYGLQGNLSQAQRLYQAIQKRY